jgi:hypothetical protein
MMPKTYRSIIVQTEINRRMSRSSTLETPVISTAHWDEIAAQKRFNESKSVLFIQSGAATTTTYIAGSRIHVYQ